MRLVSSRAFERGQVDFQGFSDKADIMTYESNIAYTLRFMVDTKVGRLGSLLCVWFDR